MELLNLHVRVCHQSDERRKSEDQAGSKKRKRQPNDGVMDSEGWTFFQILDDSGACQLTFSRKNGDYRCEEEGEKCKVRKMYCTLMGG